MACSKLVKNKIEEALECGICLDVVSDPKTLPCLHTYCAECIKQVVKLKQNAVDGLLCPKCRSFSPSGKYVNLFILNDFLDVYKMADDDPKKCNLCPEGEEGNAEWRCLDCKINICERCQKMHKKTPNCKNHKYSEYNKESATVIDKNIDCSEHGDQVVNLYCTECSKCICLVCKVTGHEGHQTETIEAASRRITEETLTNIRKIEQNIQYREVISDDIVKKYCTTKEAYRKTKELIKQQYEMTIAKLKLEFDNSIQNLQQNGLEVYQKFKSIKEETNAEMSELRSTLVLARAIVENTKGASFIRALEQGGIMEKIVQGAGKRAKSYELTLKEPVYKTDDTIDKGTFLLGTTQYTEKKLTFRAIEEVKTIFENIQLVKTFEVRGSPFNIRIANDSIWLLDSYIGKIFVYNKDGILVKILLDNLNFYLKEEFEPFAMVQVNIEVIIATYHGIDVFTLEGEKQYRVTEGAYGSISTNGDKVVAVGFDNNCEVVILKIRGRKWKIHHKFNLMKINNNMLFKGVHLINNVIYIGGPQTGHVYKYSMEGKLQELFCLEEKKDLDFKICGSDKDGSLICCDEQSNNIYRMSHSGDWQTDTISDMLHIKDVCVSGEHVYILHGKLEFIEDEFHRQVTEPFRISKFSIPSCSSQ